MKPDNIYRTLVGISPDLDSKEAWQIWRYIHDLLEDERKETVDKFTQALHNNGIDLSNDQIHKAIDDMERNQQ